MERRFIFKRCAWTHEQARSCRSPARGGWGLLLRSAGVLALVGCGEGQEPPTRWLIYGTEPVGEPCTAPPSGQSDIEGIAFGTVFPKPREANFHPRGEYFSVYASTDLGLDDSCQVNTGHLFLRIVVERRDARMGTALNVPSKAFVALENFETETTDNGQIMATFGTVTFDGYDPSTYSLCGSLDVIFNDEEGGHLTGSFQAPIRCLDPEYVKGP